MSTSTYRQTPYASAVLRLRRVRKRASERGQDQCDAERWTGTPAGSCGRGWVRCATPAHRMLKGGRYAVCSRCFIVAGGAWK